MEEEERKGQAMRSKRWREKDSLAKEGRLRLRRIDGTREWEKKEERREEEVGDAVC